MFSSKDLIWIDQCINLFWPFWVAALIVKKSYFPNQKLVWTTQVSDIRAVFSLTAKYQSLISTFWIWIKARLPDQRWLDYRKAVILWKTLIIWKCAAYALLLLDMYFWFWLEIIHLFISNWYFGQVLMFWRAKIFSNINAGTLLLSIQKEVGIKC